MEVTRILTMAQPLIDLDIKTDNLKICLVRLDLLMMKMPTSNQIILACLI